MIVQGTEQEVQRLARRYNLTVNRQLRSGGVLEVTGGQLDALSQDPDVEHISSDALVWSTMAVTTEAIGADQAWSGWEDDPAVTGGGVGVAVIDSGIGTHADLHKRIVADVDFTDGSGRGQDLFGHGTHVAGIIAALASGHGAKISETYTGVAPGVHLINSRVLGADGSGRASSVIEAIDWAIAYRERYAIRVINLSLGHPVTESYRDDPIAQAVERAVTSGIVVVASAGNQGETDDGIPIFGGIVSPGHTGPRTTIVASLNPRRWL